ncbi:semaphorin-3E-like isoform X2 [Rhinoraja longicauda]
MRSGAAWLLLMLCCRYCSAGDTGHPRLRLSYKELWGLNRSRLFPVTGGTSDIHTALLDEYRDRLVLGGRDRLWSLSLDHIDQDSREIHWPATERQRESCRLKGRDPKEGVFKLESQQIGGGRYKCPYDPHKPCASTLVGGQIFIGLYGDFFGEDPAIFRSLDSHSVTRTEHDHRLLKEPKFVVAQLIADNEDREDDKVYYFFTEKALESDTGGNMAIYSRVARLCANDVGGQRVLVNKWSTFLKTRLICSVLGPNGVETHFDDMEDVFLLQTRDHRNPDVYILFRSTSNVFQGYAVCVYHMAAIREAFHGPFAHKPGPEYHWGAYEGKVPYPRPGTCASQISAPPGGGYRSTKDYPDQVLRFIHSHPLMYQPVHPLHHKPVLMRTDGQHHLRQLVVDRVDAEDGQYDVMFIGTDAGLVLKIIVIYNQEAGTMEEVLLEELHVFKVPTAIISMEISVKRQNLYIASHSAVAQVKIHQCDLYGSACTDCCLARDPYCAWDGDTCTRYLAATGITKRRFRRQDIQHGDVARQCLDLPNDEALPKPEERVLYGIEGNSTLLECSPRSPQAQVLWFVEGSSNAREEEVKTDDRVIKTDLGLLLLNLHRMDGRMYFCKSREHSFTQTVARIRLHVLQEAQIEGLFHAGDEEGEARRRPCVLQQGTQQGGRLWYKEFLQLLGYTHLQRVEEYCQKVWCSEKRRKKNRAAASKWKYGNVQERKVRSRDLADHRRSPRHVMDS